jgi:peptidoglycan/xylan/chitin deacetylase (PgdA/CDA1 family)
MKTAIKTGLQHLDTQLASARVSVSKEHDGLISVLMHSVFASQEEAASGVMDPQQYITTDTIRQFIEYFKKHDYQFVSPKDVADGLQHGHCVMLTFDDGYYNNTSVLPLLEEYCVPAVFFISTHHVRDNKPFWWDVVYREEKKRGRSDIDISEKRRSLKHRPFHEIENTLVESYAANAAQSFSDLDRPFRPDELQSFAKNPYVWIGNHTTDHAILTTLDSQGIHAQITQAQSYLTDLVHEAPLIVSYPNGRYHDNVINVTQSLGISLGITVDQHKDTIPLGEDHRLRLGRFVLWGNKDVGKQCAVFRCDDPTFLHDSIRSAVKWFIP